KFSIERQINAEHPFNKLGKYPFANYFFGNVKAVEVVDPSTVEFVLKEPRASFLAILTAGAASIVSPAAVKKLGVDYALQPVGTAPFRHVAWDRGQGLVLERNAQYWESPVKVERGIYRPIVEDQGRLPELAIGAPARRRVARRVHHQHVGAGVGLGDAVTGSDGDRDAVEPQGGRRQRDAADLRVGRVHRQAAQQGAGAVRALLDGGQRGPRHGDV